MIDIYVGVVDTAILTLLCVWAWMDRHNKYFKDKD